MDDWEHELERLGGAVRPAGPVGGPVIAEVRRRQRRRRRGVAAGAVVVTVLAASGVAVTSGRDGRDGQDGPGGRVPVAATTPTTSTAPTDDATAVPTGPGACPTYDEVLRVAPPILDLDEQRTAIAAARTISDDFTVTRARTSPVGVLALVDGDLEHARDVLGGLGIEHVWQDLGSGPMLQWVTRPVLDDVQRETRGIPGLAGVAFWDEGGGIVVSWKAPVPSEVAVLAGHHGRVTVVVEETPYSAVDIRRAQVRLQDFLVESGLRDQWSSSTSCEGYSGLVVGMVPQAADQPGLGARIAEAVGMPVRVVAEERPVDLLPTR